MSACAYCGIRRAVNRDHVVPKSLQKKHALHPYLCETVPSCFECNMRKGTRKLIPASWAERLTLLKDEIPGQWRVWNGDPKAKSFTAVHR